MISCFLTPSRILRWSHTIPSTKSVGNSTDVRGPGGRRVHLGKSMSNSATLAGINASRWRDQRFNRVFHGYWNVTAADVQKQTAVRIMPPRPPGKAGVEREMAMAPRHLVRRDLSQPEELKEINPSSLAAERQWNHRRRAWFFLSWKHGVPWNSPYPQEQWERDGLVTANIVRGMPTRLFDAEYMDFRKEDQDRMRSMNRALARRQRYVDESRMREKVAFTERKLASRALWMEKAEKYVDEESARAQLYKDGIAKNDVWALVDVLSRQRDTEQQQGKGHPGLSA